MATPTNLPTTFVAGDILTAANMNLIRGGFRVLQVVNGFTSTTATNNTSTLADTGLTATITPQFNTSKILVLVAQNGCGKTNGNANSALQIKLLRNAVTVCTVAHFAAYTNTAMTNIIGTVSSTVLDAPATTSSTVYKTQFMNSGVNAAGVFVNDTSLSTITLLEISA